VEKPKPRLTKLQSEKIPDRLDIGSGKESILSYENESGNKFQHYNVGHHMIRKEYGKLI
jgi:hypothetical protein